MPHKQTAVAVQAPRDLPQCFLTNHRKALYADRIGEVKLDVAVPATCDPAISNPILCSDLSYLPSPTQASDSAVHLSVGIMIPNPHQQRQRQQRRQQRQQQSWRAIQPPISSQSSQPIGVKGGELVWPTHTSHVVNSPRQRCHHSRTQ